MGVVRIIAERLLLALLALTRVAFFLQGLAMATSLLAVPILAQPESAAWLQVAVRASVFVGTTLLTTAVLMTFARRLPLPTAPQPPARGLPSLRSAALQDAAAAGGSWIGLLYLSLVVLPALSYVATSDLFSLWREILQLLEEMDFWKELPSSGPYGGVVLLPIMVALLVPALEAAAAFFLIVVPLVAILLIVTRSRLFPRIFTAVVLAQAGLVLTSLIAANALGVLATEAIAVMVAAPDVEVHRAAELLRLAQGVLSSTALGLVPHALGYAAWLPFLLRSQRVGAYFTQGAETASAGSPLARA